MTNTNNTEARTRSISNIARALYEFATLDDGSVIIKFEILPREPQAVAGKVTDGKVSNTRATE
jgi:hypothetical protein